MWSHLRSLQHTVFHFISSTSIHSPTQLQEKDNKHRNALRSPTSSHQLAGENLPLGEKTNNPTATPQNLVQTPGSPPPFDNDKPIVLPRTRQPTVVVGHLLPYHSPKQSPLPMVNSPENDSNYAHGEISFVSSAGSPGPDINILPNKGGLQIEPALRRTTQPSDLDDLEAGDHRFPVRSASSSYPSEGMRSPALSASPPVTVGRRILSGLEASRFSTAHLSFLQSADYLSQGSQSDDETEVGIEELPPLEPADTIIWDFLSAKNTNGSKRETQEVEKPISDCSHHGREMTEIEPADGNPEHKSVVDLARSLSTGNKSKAHNESSSLNRSNTFPQRYKEPRSATRSMMTNRVQSSVDIPNSSTMCLPRVSGGMEETRTASVDDSLPHVNHCSRVSPLNDSIQAERESCHKRPENTKRCSFRNRISHYFQLRQTVKVKKWIVSKFRAGRRGSRVVAKKVKQRNARIVSNGKRKGKTLSVKKPRDGDTPLFHGGFHEDKKRVGSLSKSIRTLRQSVSAGLFGGGARGSGAGITGKHAGKDKRSKSKVGPEERQPEAGVDVSETEVTETVGRQES
ncbi:hypothetical protein V8F20_007421 [Naviculisporaceae sp. PSN 640]